MAKQPFKPQALRAVLVVVLILIISGGAGLFYLGLIKIQTYAVEVNHTIADAEASGTQIQRLQALKGQLSQSEALISKANQMFANQENYQAQAITDIRNYANAAGLTITKTNFDVQEVGANPSMTVSLKSPVSYGKLIQFLDGIEGNIPKMQVTGIGINHVNGGNADTVIVDDIKITIATRA
ncbi:MAG: hypothetical protein JWN28_235 [Candidatus Saccharibacteria bacterium]|nr:hypothetical protein [Candidatus Saccharibacteria bacterium]